MHKPMTLEQLQTLQGQPLGTSGWHTLDQPRINGFADVTEDWQFIHVDPQRAQTESPFGGTIAHGFLALSLLPAMAGEAMPWFNAAAVVINYGCNTIRFLTPMPSDSRVRGHFTLQQVTPKTPERTLLGFHVEMEIEDHAKPALVAEWLGMLVSGQGAS